MAHGRRRSPFNCRRIPLYNGSRFIEQAIRSVLDQTRRPDECIAVDDGPEVVAILAQTFPVRLLRKPNGGQSSARDYGVAHSTANLIAFLDRDDAWYLDHLARLLAPFVDRAGDRALGCVYADLDEAGQFLTRNLLRPRAAKHPKTSVADCLEDDMFVLPSASLIARHAFEAEGDYDELLSGYENDDLPGPGGGLPLSSARAAGHPGVLRHRASHLPLARRSSRRCVAGPG